MIYIYVALYILFGDLCKESLSAAEFHDSE